MKNRIKIIVVLLGLLLGASTLAAEPTTAISVGESARARLDAFAHDLHSLSGHFTQTLIDANGQRGDTSKGTVALQAPRQFRWQTVSPYKQLIVADGSRVWMYDPELEQVTVRMQSTEEAHSPLTILTDMSQLDHDFKATDLGSRDGLVWLRLKPAGERAQFDYAELGFDGEQLRRMRFKDQLGNQTTIEFSDWKRNQDLPASLFAFTPPEGADVVGDLPVTEVHALH